MARETAAQKLAKRNAELEEEREREAAAAAAGGESPADPPAAEAKAPVLADYTLFGLESQGDPASFVWVPLGDVKAPTYQHAMDMAKDAMRDRVLAAATEEAPAPPTLKLTVAAIASRNWNQGTAIVELRPVTTWEK